VKKIENFSHPNRSRLTPHAGPTRHKFFKWIGCKDYELPKNRNFESFSAKNELYFFTQPLFTHPPVPASPLSKNLWWTQKSPQTQSYPACDASREERPNTQRAALQVRLFYFILTFYFIIVTLILFVQIKDKNHHKPNPTRRATPHGRRDPICNVPHSRSAFFILYWFVIS
jgi:hypothetical protein